MSLESQIADLVSATNSLIATFNTKKSGIDAAVAAAIAAVPSMAKTNYVNQLTGSDTNDGTAASPLKTIDKAIGNTPVGGVARVMLQADYVLSVNVSLDARTLILYSDVSGTKRKVTSSYYSSENGTISYLAGFAQSNGGQMLAQDITFVIPGPAGVVPAPGGFTTSLFKSTAGGGAIICSVKLTSCDVQAAADFNGTLVGAPNSAVVFEAVSTTFPSAFGGRYIYGAAAGTAVASLSNLVTNLTAI